MHLNNTEVLMKRMLDSLNLDSYGIIVGINGDIGLIHSGNVDAETLFDAASMTKVLVTSTLALKLIGEGRLNLNDTLEHFFDNVPYDKKAVTVKHLLTHTSGIVRFSVVIPKEIADKGKDDIASYLMSSPLPYPVGSTYSYSCYGYILLGFIVEKMYDMPLDEAFNIHLKKALGYTRVCFNPEENEENLAVCIRRKNRGLYEVDDENAYTLKGISGNASSFWSLSDIQKYISAVLNKDEKLYKKELFELAEANHTPEMEEGRGLGYLVTDKNYFQTGKLLPEGSFGHCGHTGQSFFINRELNMYVIILTNATRFAALKNDFTTYNYGDIMKMREAIHNEIYNDLKEQNLI